jgi:hypothetical protein
MPFNYKTLLSCSALIFCFASCLTVTEITLKQDGSAHVAFTNGGASLRKDFYKSDQITDLTWLDDSVNLSFNIKTIDSLGNYLYEDFEKNYFKFHYSNDTLTFTDGNTPTYRYKRYPCWMSEIRITSDQKIKSVETKNSFVKHKKNTVIIEKAGRKFKKKEKDTKVVVVFGE